MATMAPTATATATLTPPSSSHGNQHSWGTSDGQNETLNYDKSTMSTFDHASRDLDDNHGYPTPQHVADDRSSRTEARTEGEHSDEDKWIHRDKLALIENEELQAAGISIPQPRAASKQRRGRSRSAMRRGTEASEVASHHNRSRKNSAAVDQPSWDLRTPEGIAEGEGHAYFGANSIKGGVGSRIPVPKSSHNDRASSIPRNKSESPDADSLVRPSTRSRSSSMKLLDSIGPTMQPGKKSTTDPSPKKNGAGTRKATQTKGTARPKTRSGTNRESNGTARPTTRSGDLSQGINKAPEGDPPWMINSYKPDPRLPPDQQLLPTVARRLQQEQWEREGKFGDVYDKEFRPLNDNTFLRTPDAEMSPELRTEADKDQDETDTEKHGGEWPLRAEDNKSPTQRQNSYSTMPRISDKPQVSPLPSPRTPAAATMGNIMPPQEPQPQPQPKPHTPLEEPSTKTECQGPERVPEAPEDDGKKGGCGCCVVM